MVIPSSPTHIYHAVHAASQCAWVLAGPQLVQTVEGFKSLLPNPDDAVVQRAFMHLASQVQLAHTEQYAAWVYDRALALPGSSTILQARQSGNLLINGDYLPNVVSKSSLVYAFRGSKPLLLKIPGDKAAAHEDKIYRTLSGGSSGSSSSSDDDDTRPPRGLAGPLKLVTLKVGN